jgi:hypothetical protein
MKKTPVMLTALTLAALTACNTGTSGTNEPPERTAVRFSGTLKPAQGRAAGTSWDQGDAIGVFMLEQGETQIADTASNRRYLTQTGNGSFSPASAQDTIYYPDDPRQVDFIAYYPYSSEIQKFAYPVDVHDQTNQGAIDLMTADRVSSSSQTADPVALRFRHRLSRLELDILPGTNLTDTALIGLQAAITGQRTTGSFDVTSNTLSTSNTGEASIPLRMAGNGQYGEGILLPAEAQAGRRLVFTLGSKEFSYTIPAAHEFKAGIRNKYTITLKGSGPDGSQDFSVENVISTIIEDWSEGSAEEPPPPPEPEPEPEPPKADKTITLGYDRGTITLRDEQGNPLSPDLTLSKAAKASLTLKAETGFTGVVWYLDSKAYPGETYTLRAEEQDIKTHALTFTGWRNGTYLSSESILITITP